MQHDRERKKQRRRRRPIAWVCEGDASTAFEQGQEKKRIYTIMHKEKYFFAKNSFRAKKLYY